MKTKILALLLVAGVFFFGYSQDLFGQAKPTGQQLEDGPSEQGSISRPTGRDGGTQGDARELKKGLDELRTRDDTDPDGDTGDPNEPPSTDQPRTSDDDGYDYDDDDYDDPNDPGYPDQPGYPDEPGYPPYDYPEEGSDYEHEEGARELKRMMKTSIKLSSYTVGIGASAGSRDALKEMLENIPKNIDISYVVVQHPDPKQKPVSPGALSAMTEMSVIQAADGTELERNKIYVIPPGVNMSVSNNILNVVPKSELKDSDMPIDHFFTSLAKDQTIKTVGVILSGDTTDGALGLKEIKDRGGRAYVQDAKTAEYSKMPESAAAMGVANLVTTPKEIGQQIKTLKLYPKGQMQEVLDQHSDH